MDTNGTQGGNNSAESGHSSSDEGLTDVLEAESEDVREEVVSTSQLRREVEDFDSLDTVQPDPVGFWEDKQRDLVTSVVDYNLETLAGLVQGNTIDLSPRYQRRFRWDAVRQSRLIESFLMNVPIPPVFLNEDEYGHYSVIDGKQRLRAIVEFLRGSLKLKGLKVFSDINGSRFEDLPETLQNVIRTRASIRAVIILRQSDSDIKYEVFQRLNTGGVRLNPQEIRNSSWSGSLNDLILDLSEEPLFHAILGIKDKSRSGIFKEMRDAEFVLRFLTFRENWATFSGGMMRHMDEYMRDSQHASEDKIKELRLDFLNTLALVRAALGENAFRRWEPERQAWRRQVLAALYDAEMFALRGRNLEAVTKHQAAIADGLKALFSDEEFQKSISAATNTPALFKSRIERVSSMFDAALG
jgi:Protein of unknown function DUF262